MAITISPEELKQLPEGAMLADSEAPSDVISPSELGVKENYSLSPKTFGKQGLPLGTTQQVMGFSQDKSVPQARQQLERTGIPNALRGVGGLVSSVVDPYMLRPVDRQAASQVAQGKTPIPSPQEQTQLAKTTALGFGIPGVAKTGETPAVKSMAPQQAEQFFDKMKQKWNNALKGNVFSALPPNESKILKDPTKSAQHVENTISAMDNVRKKINSGELEFRDINGNIVVDRMPKDYFELQQVVNTGKKQAFREYDDLMRSSGASFDSTAVTNAVKSELQQLLENDTMQRNFPGAVREIKQKLARLEKNPYKSLSSVQEDIQAINNKFGGKVDINSFDAALVNNMVANRLRSIADDIITKDTSPGYAAARKMYGNYRAIEDGVNKTNNKLLADSTKTHISLWDAISASELMHALAAHSPSAAVSGGFTAGLSAYIKRMRDPNLRVEKLFKNLEKRDKDLAKWAPNPKPPTNYPLQTVPQEKFKMNPYYPEVMPVAERSIVPGVRPRTIEAEVLAPPQQSLGGGQRVGLLESPRVPGVQQAGWTPQNRPGAAADRMGNIQAPEANIKLQQMAKKLYEMGYSPTEIQEMIRQELLKRGR